MPDKVGLGGTIRLDAQYIDGSGQLVNPVTPLIEILDANNVQRLAPTAPTNDGVGLFHRDYAVPAAGVPTGLWKARWTGSINGVPVTGDEFFEVVPAGSLVFSGVAYSTKEVLRAAPYGLTTAEASDAVVDAELLAMSRLIDRVTGDHFAPEDALTLRLAGDGRYLFLPRRVRAITSVTVFGGLLASTVYAVHTSLNAAGTDFSPAADFDALELDEGGKWPGGVFQGEPPVAVLGNFSWAAPPGPIALACAKLAHYHLKPSQIPPDVTRWTTETTTFERPSIGIRTEDGQDDITTGYADVDALLEAYRRGGVLG